MVKKSIYFLMLIIFLLTGCGSKHQNVIDEVSNGIKDQDIPDVTMNIIEINSYIIFDVSEKDIIVRAVKKDFLETDKKLINNYNDFNEKNHFQRGCIYFEGKNIYSACGGIYNDPLLIETSDMSKVIGGIMPATLQMTLGTLLGGESVDKSLKRTKEQFVKTEYNQDVTNSFGKVINGKIYQEYKENLLSESPEKLSNFINKYNITTIRKEPYQKLISLYVNQNTFNGFINAYKINNALKYADNAYKAASTKEEFEQLLFNVERNQYKELIDKTIQRLIVIYRDENTFNSYLNAYRLIGDSTDGKKALSLALSDENKSLLEFEACKKIRNKENLFNINLSNLSSNINNGETSGGLFSKHTFAGTLNSQTNIEVSLNKESPLMPKFIKFKVILQSDLEANSHKQRRSKWLGNLDEDFTNRNSNTKEVLIYANSLTNRYVENIKLENIVYFDRGSANGFTAIWPTNNAKISTRITNVECVK